MYNQNLVNNSQLTLKKKLAKKFLIIYIVLSKNQQNFQQQHNGKLLYLAFILTLCHAMFFFLNKYRPDYGRKYEHYFLL
jgi:hypothetical protein